MSQKAVEYDKEYVMAGYVVTEKLCYIDLNYREDQCCICGDLTPPTQGVPMYEDLVLPNDWSGEWYGRTACRKCFELQELITAWLPMTAYDFAKMHGKNQEDKRCRPKW